MHQALNLSRQGKTNPTVKASGTALPGVPQSVKASSKKFVGSGNHGSNGSTSYVPKSRKNHLSVSPIRPNDPRLQSNSKGLQEYENQLRHLGVVGQTRKRQTKQSDKVVSQNSSRKKLAMSKSGSKRELKVSADGKSSLKKQ